MAKKLALVAFLLIAGASTTYLHVVPSDDAERVASLAAHEMMGQWVNMHGDFRREWNRLANR